MEDELWMPIKDWNGKYWISNHGRFKSIGGKYTKLHPDGYVTLGFPDTTGYKSAMLRRPGVSERNRIHVYVAEHFCLKIKGCECVNHLDGDKWNNYYKNLEWDTMGGNVRHAVATGLMNMKGENHPNGKLKEVEVIQMRILRKSGSTYQKIANQYGVNRRHASDVIRGINWGWLKEGL